VFHRLRERRGLDKGTDCSQRTPVSMRMVMRMVVLVRFMLVGMRLMRVRLLVWLGIIMAVRVAGLVLVLLLRLLGVDMLGKVSTFEHVDFG
jgi:hypothetical protein